MTAAAGFASREAAGAFVAAAEAAAASLAVGELPEFFDRLASAWDEFPELELETPRRAAFERLRAAAEALPDEQALPLLLLCAACDPGATAALFAHIRPQPAPSLPVRPQSAARFPVK